MGKKLDALLGRSFRASKLKATATLAVSRLAVLKNQRQARCSVARSDVIEFLKNSNHDRALLRVEQVIKEQNMLDVLDLVEGYCHLLIERVKLIEQEKFCPEELKEAVSSLIYAASRCGDFPELQEIRTIFTSRYGKEFAARAVELRNNCGVNSKIIQKLSTRMPTLENKMKALKDIALENNIDLPAEVTVSDTTLDLGQKNEPKPSSTAPIGVPNPGPGEENLTKTEQYAETDEDFSDSVKLRREYRDVADAAQAAFESAAYAASAARAAVQLSRSAPTDPTDPSGPHPGPKKSTAMFEPTKSELRPSEKDPLEDDHVTSELKFEKIRPVQNYELENPADFKRPLSVSSLDSDDDDDVKSIRKSHDDESWIKLRDVVFDESEGEDEEKSGVHEIDLDDADQKNDIAKMSSRDDEHFPLRSQVGLEAAALSNSPAEKSTPSAVSLNINRRPVSVRTRRTRGQ